MSSHRSQNDVEIHKGNNGSLSANAKAEDQQQNMQKCMDILIPSSVEIKMKEKVLHAAYS